MTNFLTQVQSSHFQHRVAHARLYRNVARARGDFSEHAHAENQIDNKTFLLNSQHVAFLLQLDN